MIECCLTLTTSCKISSRISYFLILARFATRRSNHASLLPLPLCLDNLITCCKRPTTHADIMADIRLLECLKCQDAISNMSTSYAPWRHYTHMILCREYSKRQPDRNFLSVFSEKTLFGLTETFQRVGSGMISCEFWAQDRFCWDIWVPLRGRRYAPLLPTACHLGCSTLTFLLLLSFIPCCLCSRYCTLNLNILSEARRISLAWNYFWSFRAYNFYHLVGSLLICFFQVIVLIYFSIDIFRFDPSTPRVGHDSRSIETAPSLLVLRSDFIFSRSLFLIWLHSVTYL